MSERTKTPLINSKNTDLSILYVTCGQRIYAIPRRIIEKYSTELIPSDVVFAHLQSKLTKTGALLRGLRTREGLTQVEFAKKINATQSNLSNMENGRRSVGKNMAKRIEQVFGIDYRYFL